MKLSPLPRVSTRVPQTQSYCLRAFRNPGRSLGSFCRSASRVNRYCPRAAFRPAKLAAGDPRIRAQRFAVNCGQTAALWAGLKIARGQYLFTLDADLQNDPKDLPKFLEPLKQYDCVCGTRVETRGKGDNFIRIASSRIANWVRNKLSHEQISDVGCTLRGFKRECIENLKFFNGMHRFMPTLFKIEGFTVTEIAVTHNPRFAGQTNYGVWNRLFVSFHDLLAVRWMQKRMFRYQVAERVN